MLLLYNVSALPASHYHFAEVAAVHVSFTSVVKSILGQVVDRHVGALVFIKHRVEAVVLVLEVIKAIDERYV